MWYKINVEQSSCNNYFDLLFSMEFSFLYFDLLVKTELICLVYGNRKVDELLHVVPAAVVHLMVK